MAEDPENPVEQLVENLLYAPVGLALEAKENWSTYIERGRSQVTISRFLARTATQKSTSSAERIADRLVNEVGQVIVDLFGIDLTPEDESAPESASDAEALAFPIVDYDECTAATVVSRLATLTPRQLEAVRAREIDGKARVTVLRKIEQLLGST